MVHAPLSISGKPPRWGGHSCPPSFDFKIHRPKGAERTCPEKLGGDAWQDASVISSIGHRMPPFMLVVEFRLIWRICALRPLAVFAAPQHGRSAHVTAGLSISTPPTCALTWCRYP